MLGDVAHDAEPWGTSPGLRPGYTSAAPMPTSRMRRVNEVMREVLGTAIADDLQDPRIGFVTVTAVDTSPDLRPAQVHVSVLGDRARSARTTLAALQRVPRRPAGRDQRRAAAEAHAGAAFHLRRHRSSAAARITRMLDEDEGARTTAATDRRDERARRRARSRRRGRPRAGRPLSADDPRGPRRRRARLAAGDCTRSSPSSARTR